jgi:hypothetical protein
LYYHWQRADSIYIAQEMYLSSVPSLVSERPAKKFIWMPQNDAYTVYNPTNADVVLKIPPKIAPSAAAKMSQNRGRALDTGWDVWFEWKDAGRATGTSRIRCGLNTSLASPVFSPSAPRFGRLRAGVVDTAHNVMYGHAIMEAPDREGGCVFPISIVNRNAGEYSVEYRVANTQCLAQGMRAVLFNPAAADTENIDIWHTITLPSNAIDYRRLIVGSQAYIGNFLRNFRPLKLGLDGAYPNPSRGRLNIFYTVPFSGVRSLDFSIYDLNGRLVWERHISGPVAAGRSMVVWDGTDPRAASVAGGVYLLTMKARESGGRNPQIFKTKVTFLK